MPNISINTKLAVELKNKGMSWQKIGKRLSELDRPAITYQALSVYKAVIKEYEMRNGKWVIKWTQN